MIKIIVQLTGKSISRADLDIKNSDTMEIDIVFIKTF